MYPKNCIYHILLQMALLFQSGFNLLPGQGPNEVVGGGDGAVGGEAGLVGGEQGPEQAGREGAGFRIGGSGSLKGGQEVFFRRKVNRKHFSFLANFAQTNL